MIALIACLAVLAALSLASRIGVPIIERLWPPIGEIRDFDGHRLHVLDLPAADADAPALLLIHGASGNLRDPVEALRSALGGRYRLIAVDRPGHGHSPRGKGGHMADPARQADAIAAMLHGLGASPCVVLGHSWGTAVAAALAQRHPDCVAALVLAAPATHPWPGGISRRTQFFARAFLGRAIADILVLPVGLFLVPPGVKEVFEPSAPPPDYAGRTGVLLAIRPATFVHNARDVAELRGHLLRQSALYDRISAPTEVVTSDVDSVVAPAIHAYGLARDIPGARLTVLPDAGHMPHWTRPQEVVAAIDRAAARARDEVG